MPSVWQSRTCTAYIVFFNMLRYILSAQNLTRTQGIGRICVKKYENKWHMICSRKNIFLVNIYSLKPTNFLYVYLCDHAIFFRAVLQSLWCNVFPINQSEHQISLQHRWYSKLGYWFLVPYKCPIPNIRRMLKLISSKHYSDNIGGNCYVYQYQDFYLIVLN
jgi:hypothetical protein